MGVAIGAADPLHIQPTIIRLPAVPRGGSAGGSSSQHGLFLSSSPNGGFAQGRVIVQTRYF
ncbi:MAG: hypothetical protein WAU91_05505 [Desulfatitalea sp.]